jgi:hypothetical protein
MGNYNKDYRRREGKDAKSYLHSDRKKRIKNENSTVKTEERYRETLSSNTEASPLLRQTEKGADYLVIPPKKLLRKTNFIRLFVISTLIVLAFATVYFMYFYF